MATKRYKKKDVEKLESRTDYERLKRMTEDEIRRNAESDPDAPLQSDEDLKRFEQVKTPRGGRKNDKD